MLQPAARLVNPSTLVRESRLLARQDRPEAGFNLAERQLLYFPEDTRPSPKQEHTATSRTAARYGAVR